MDAMIRVLGEYADGVCDDQMSAGTLSMLIINGFRIFMVETFSGRNKGKLTVLVFSFVSLGIILPAVILWHFLSEPKNGSYKIQFCAYRFCLVFC